jgi:hypothetical protein
MPAELGERKITESDGWHLHLLMAAGTDDCIAQIPQTSYQALSEIT